MSEFKLIVAGGRDFGDVPRFEEELIRLAEGGLADYNVSVVSGMARGADRMAAQFAQANAIQLYRFPANWDQYGKRAGFIRNGEMANFADGLLAFWDGKSRGTANMIETMENKHKPVWIIYY